MALRLLVGKVIRTIPESQRVVVHCLKMEFDSDLNMYFNKSDYFRAFTHGNETVRNGDIVVISERPKMQCRNAAERFELVCSARRAVFMQYRSVECRCGETVSLFVGSHTVQQFGTELFRLHKCSLQNLHKYEDIPDAVLHSGFPMDKGMNISSRGTFYDGSHRQIMIPLHEACREQMRRAVECLHSYFTEPQGELRKERTTWMYGQPRFVALCDKTVTQSTIADSRDVSQAEWTEMNELAGDGAIELSSLRVSEVEGRKGEALNAESQQDFKADFSICPRTSFHNLPLYDVSSSLIFDKSHCQYTQTLLASND